MANSQTLSITAADATTFDTSVTAIQKALLKGGAEANLCELYAQIRPYLDTAIAVAGNLGWFGGRVKDVLTALQQVLESVCPRSSAPTN